MIHDNGVITLSASDLAAFLGCTHRTALDMAVAIGARAKPEVIDDPLLDALQERGLKHEAQYVDSLRRSGRTVVDLRDGVFSARVQDTLHPMRAGVDVIVQGALRDAPWMGYPDVLLRVDTPSALGAWSYEVVDTKLSRTTRAGTILQLGLYSAMLHTTQGVAPYNFHVVTPDAITPQQSYRVNDYAAYVRLVCAKLRATVATPWEQVAEAHYPEPVESCLVCRWQSTCAARRRADDHLSLVAGISRTQREELAAQRVDTLTGLSQLALPIPFKPRRGSTATYERVREQARLQLASRGTSVPLYDVLDTPAPRTEAFDEQPPMGLHRLPEPSPGDLFLDLEGDPFVADGGREYLFGLVAADGSYQARWAFTEREEKATFMWVMDAIGEAIATYPDMHVYHYAPYEPAAFKRLMGRHATRERELDAILRAERFVDLYGVVRQGLRVGVERYSIKNLEPLYGYTRDVPLYEANRVLRAMELGLMNGTAASLPPDIHSAVEGYNRDDCVSTLRLRDWLESVRSTQIASGVDMQRPTRETGDASTSVDEKAQRVDTLRERLLHGVPEEKSARDAESQGRWLMAYMLDYHRREDKATWWEYFRLRGLSHEELVDEREAVVGLEFVAEVERVKRSVVHRYTYPPQEMEIDVGDEVRAQDGEGKFGEVYAIDREQRTIDIKKGPTKAALHPRALFAFTFISPDAMEKAMLRVGECIADGSEGSAAARTLLERRFPALRDTVLAPGDGESTLAYAVRAGLALHESVLPIQGPPGAGKTYCGAHMVCELVRQGKRVGITANSHAVIRNLMDAVAEHADTLGVTIRFGHKIPSDADPAETPAHIAAFTKNDAARRALDDGTVNVLGGTAWLWASDDLTASVDVLCVDEAGQMALANAVAVSQAARSMVLLGDPQQLEQPRKGTHPDGVGISALEHMLGGAETLSADRGIFLGETWRLCPDLCAFTSEMFYEGRLSPRDGLERQQLTGVAALPARGLVLMPVEHDGNRNASDEEQDAVEQLVQQLTQSGACWTDRHGASHALRGDDILVVAPYNAHVTRLAARLAAYGVPVGTVDKFQGQEAPVVIYTTATSRPEDAPRGMEFLYSLNRLNVATSRARCVAIVVASARLFEPDCQSPRQMQLANAMCRYREMAALV